MGRPSSKPAVKGLRYNGGKPRMSLTSPWAQEGLAKVLTYGEQKYAAWNWAKGLSWGETVDSLERHLAAFKKGEDIDDESGLPHIDHIQCNAMFLSHFQKLGDGIDDRWRRHKTGAHESPKPAPSRLHQARRHQPASAGKRRRSDHR